MRRVLTLIAVLLSLAASAQQFHGRVQDSQTGQPLSKVLVRNLRSGALWVSDSVGNIAFTSFPGDLIRFSKPGYHDVTESIVSYEQQVDVRLARAPIQLQEVKVLSPYARYQRDSAFNRLVYRQQIGFAKPQSKLDLSNGIGANGLISDLALAVSGKKKYYKNFVANMELLEDLRYSGIRYTTEVVTGQTGLDDSAAAQFIQRNPMPAEIARNAGELEFKMWIRTAFRQERRNDSLRAVSRSR